MPYRTLGQQDENANTCNEEEKELSPPVRRHLKNLAKWTWIYFLWIAGLLRFAKWRMARCGGLVVLTFHRVVPDAVIRQMYSLPGMVVRESTFDSLLAYVSQHLEIGDLRYVQSDRIPEQRRLAVALTFDDGWADNCKIAHPITQAFGIPITIFICPGKMGLTAPFWPEKVIGLLRSANISNGTGDSELTQLLRELAPALQVSFSGDRRFPAESIVENLKQLSPERRQCFIQRLEKVVDTLDEKLNDDLFNKTMSWPDAKLLSANGVAFGSHTQNHQILTSLPLNQARQELSTSKKQIEEHLNQPCRIFAYPNGNFNSEVATAVREAGYDLAFTTRPGFWTRQSDPHRIPRINIWEGKLVGLDGKFSALAFQYTVFWKAFLSRRG